MACVAYSRVQLKTLSSLLKRFFRKLRGNSCFRLPQHFIFCTHYSCLFSQLLEIYVFDDADPEPAAYLGLAKVPLITLANDKPIKGTFELRKASRVTGLRELGMVLIAFMNGFSA